MIFMHSGDMKTSFTIWTERLAALWEVASVSDAKLGRVLGLHRNSIADFKRGRTLHTPPKPAGPDLRTRLAMSAILAGLQPWPETLEEEPKEAGEAADIPEAIDRAESNSEKFEK